MTLSEFLLARIAEDERAAGFVEVSASTYPRWHQHSDGNIEKVTPENWSAPFMPARVLAECEAKRRIVEWHKSWPVLAQTPPTFDQIGSDSDINSVTFRASQQMAWLTEQEYRDRFGSEPPTAPVLALLALPYADHPDYDEAWRP